MYFMKLTLLLLFTFIATGIYAQKDTVVNVLPKRAQSVYGELGGNGIVFSANYDVRFAKSQKGLGARIGIGGLATYLTIPVALNYLAGKAPNYFEGGLGITYATDASYTSDHGTVIVFSAGYRYQPIKSGLTARVILSPLVATNGDGFLFFGGVSVGYKF
jgi:hypothetical protein